MNDFDVYILWLLEQHRQRALDKSLTMYAQFRQLKASQPRRPLWLLLRLRLHMLRQHMRALSARLARSRSLHQDTPSSAQDLEALVSVETPPGHRVVRRDKRGVAVGP